MGRSTVYNNITSPEKLAQVNPENIQLGNDFLDYLTSTDRAASTIKQYRANLNVFWCWNLEFNNNKFFVDIKKREVSRFQGHAISVWGWSPKRLRTVKATLSSLSNYIENILDEDFENYRPIINSVESPANNAVREKSVFSEEELQAVLDTLVKQHEYMRACLLSLAMNSGRRKAELRMFKASYFRKKNLICEGALYQTPEKMRTKGKGSAGKMIDVYILAKSFDKYLNLWLQERERLGITSDWLFPKKVDGKYKNEPIEISSLDYLASVFSRMLDKPFYWHSMRHFFTTRLVEANIPTDVIQDVIGWSSLDMVQIYDDTTKEKKFDKYFGAGGIKEVKQGSLIEL